MMAEVHISAELYHAVCRNDYHRVQELLDNGADPNQFYDDMENISSRSILHVCCAKGCLETARVLVDRGADILSRDKWRMSPLVYAIMPQFTETVEFLLSRCPDVGDMCDKYGKAPLHYAVESGCIEIVQMLIQFGADVNIGTMRGITPLMSCATSGTGEGIKMMKLLISSDALIDLKDVAAKRTALQYAALKMNIKAVELLLENNADTNTLDGAGRTPLTNVMRQSIKPRPDGNPLVNDTCMSIIVMLLQKGTNLSCNICEECNPLMVATLLRSEELVEFFLVNGADPFIRFASGATPLLWAVHNCDYQIVKTLLQYNSPCHHKGRITKRREELYLNPFELAVYFGQWDIVDMIIEFGYNVSKHNYLSCSTVTHDIPPTFDKFPDILLRLREIAASPITLFKHVLLSIRRILRTDLETKVNGLPIPQSLRDQILMRQ